MYALTALDPDFKVKGSRDPLGFQHIWSEAGRSMINYLSTVSEDKTRMDKFKGIREKIGKDLTWRLPKANRKDEWGEIVFDWKFNIGSQWYIHEVGDKFRTNSLSNVEGRYTVINYGKEKKGRIYINIHNYTTYVRQIFLNNPENRITDFDFIYVWDEYDKKLILLWEHDSSPGKDIQKIDNNFAKIFLGTQYEKYRESSDVIFID